MTAWIRLLVAAVALSGFMALAGCDESAEDELDDAADEMQDAEEEMAEEADDVFGE